MPKEVEYSDAIKLALKNIVDDFDKEDESTRQRQIRLWKRLTYMWSGFQKLYWSEVAHDWRIFENVNEGSDDQGYYDKTINVFRAYLESIIAAMSATVPGVKCKPDDAENVNDITTAKGGTKIAKLIYQHNDAPLLWAKALYIYCTQGMIACYNYTDYDDKYGLVNTPDYKESEEEVTNYVCPTCGTPLDDLNFQTSFNKELQESDEFDPDNDGSSLHNIINKGQVICENCQNSIDPELKNEKITVTRMVGITQKPKARQILEIEGGLYVKVPNYARCQADIPYLAYCYETHYSFVYKKYPKLRNESGDSNNSQDTSGNNEYERWGRLSPQYYGEYPLDTPTVRNWWIRPSSFECCKDDDVRTQLYKKFPDGCKVVYVNEHFAEAKNEDLDDHWTLTYNPLSEFIHFDPLGLLLTSVQEITNDLISLTLQTIEQGIPQTFADPSVLNFKQYSQTEVLPGDIFPAKPKSGKSIADGFYEVKTAQLSQEIGPFGEKIQELGQFVSGAMPSLFGGDQNNSSRTASQYAMSRAQSLQRLQTPWKMLTFWWKNIFGKVIPAYIKNMMDDERVVKPNGDSWINILIKKAEMDGKLGDVELEAADDIPMSTAQSRDLLMQLFNINNPAILSALASPENLPLLYEAAGLNDFYIPGENDREKQLEEIQILINSQPTPTINQQTGQPDEETSVMPELMVDSHDVEGQICRNWLVGEAGRQCKVENPTGYQNVLLHLKMHLQMMQMLQGGMGNQQPPNQPGNPNSPQPPQKPVMGQTTQEESPNNTPPKVM